MYTNILIFSLLLILLYLLFDIVAVQELDKLELDDIEFNEAILSEILRPAPQNLIPKFDTIKAYELYFIWPVSKVYVVKKFLFHTNLV